MSYDAVSQSYRGWSFFSNGVAEYGTATWDGASKTFTWTIHSPVTDLTTVTRVAFISPDQEIIEFTTTDGAGKVVDKNCRKKLRRPEDAAPKKTAEFKMQAAPFELSPVFQGLPSKTTR